MGKKVTAMKDATAKRTLHLNVHKIVEQNKKYFIVSARETVPIKTLSELFNYFE